MQLPANILTYGARFLETGLFYRFEVLGFTESGDGFHTETIRHTTQESASSRLNRFQSGGVPAAHEGVTERTDPARDSKLRRPSISGRQQPLADEVLRSFKPHALEVVVKGTPTGAKATKSFVKKVDPSTQPTKKAPRRVRSDNDQPRTLKN